MGLGSARIVLLLALLSSAQVARADYVFDPTKVPPDFTCDKEWNAKRCASERRYRAWWTDYGDRYDRWFHAMLFDTGSYFDGEAVSDPVNEPEHDDPWDPKTALAGRTGNLVDAVYQVALRRFTQGWGFAIAMDCGEHSNHKMADCAPRLRMVSFKPEAKVDKAQAQAVESLLPTSKEELPQLLRILADWREADLRSCPGALAQLQAFPAQKGRSFWHPRYVDWLRGHAPAEPDEVIVTADGSGVFLRAESRGDPVGVMPASTGSIVYNQWNGGEGFAWALRMAEVVEPCLKPASAPAPWDRAVAPDDRTAAKAKND